jgi:hypothetical protein
VREDDRLVFEVTTAVAGKQRSGMNGPLTEVSSLIETPADRNLACTSSSRHTVERDLNHGRLACQTPARSCVGSLTFSNR